MGGSTTSSRKRQNVKSAPDVTDGKRKKANFEVLNDNDDGGTVYSDASAMTIEEIEEEKPKKAPRMPPIVVKSKIADTKSFYANLKKQVENIHFRTFNTTKQIFTYTSEDFAKIIEWLKSNTMDYYTYTLKAELCKKLVLKGLDKDLEYKEILENLQMQHSGICDVKQMHIIPKYTKSSPTESPQTDLTPQAGPSTATATHTRVKRVKIGAFVVYIKRECNTSDIIKDIRHVLDHVIAWERYNKRENPATFCGRCARWGHSSRNCNMPIRCLRTACSIKPKMSLF
ncbi:uncharacterized protein LOC132257006 [Phlebotomus argentipes]|uniref:uncharacterized protein LOC132257006 n=1 Tax=Phlebotomus argentipes TaxID=94469 RepID=UPI002893812A|nr:uncharacterized protein LOC132257006 [Phlebotomus argentipes]